MSNRYRIEFILVDLSTKEPLDADDIRDTIQIDFEPNDLEVEGEIKITRIIKCPENKY